MGTLKDNFKYADILRAPSQGQLSLLSDENAYNFDPNRYAFYMHFINALNDPNESLVPSILNIVNTSKLTLRQYSERVTDIMKSLKFAVKKQTNEAEHIKKINILLRSNPLTSGFYIKLRDEDKNTDSSGKALEIENAVSASPPPPPPSPPPPSPPPPPPSPPPPAPAPGDLVRTEIITHTHYEGDYIYVGQKFEHLPKDLKGDKITYDQLNANLDDSLKIKNDTAITPQLVEQIYNRYFKDSLYGIALNTKTNDLTSNDNVIKYPITVAGGKYDLYQLGGEAITYYSQLNKKINDLEVEPETPVKNEKDRLINIGKEDRIREVVKDYEDDPIFGLDTEKITSTDRAIFIALTYIIRAISLFLLNWSINSNMVKNFENAFILYFVSYISIFLIIVILVNTENNLFFRMLLYYLDSKNNGWGRIMVHILIQLGLMPIIWMLKISSESLKITDFNTSQRLYNVIADYTFFIWLFSSIIALQY